MTVIIPIIRRLCKVGGVSNLIKLFKQLPPRIILLCVIHIMIKLLLYFEIVGVILLYQYVLIMMSFRVGRLRDHFTAKSPLLIVDFFEGNSRLIFAGTLVVDYSQYVVLKIP